MRRAKRTAKSIWQEAAKAPNKETRKRLGEWASTSEKRERLNAMIALARSEQPIPVAVESLDADPWLLNCLNGTLDLRTGILREHRRDDYLSKLCPVEYPTESGDDPELWLAFLNRIFADRKPLIQFVQRLMGSSLVGEVHEHKLPIFYGSGANGKSVLIEAWCGMLGADYAMKAPSNFLVSTKSDRHPTELADLHGKRLVAAVESSDGGRLSEVLVKELTGGDSIRARRMREDFWQFRPSHTVVLATNHRPVVRGTDNGIWRRLLLVPFEVTIPEAEQDKQLAQKLHDEYPAILRWTMAGCLDWQRHGLQAPENVASATATYRSDMDVLGEFLEECCDVDAAYESTASDIYKRYKTWAEDRGEYVETQTSFGVRLTERGFQKGKRSGRVRYPRHQDEGQLGQLGQVLPMTALCTHAKSLYGKNVLTLPTVLAGERCDKPSRNRPCRQPLNATRR
jgi:putative DNA primase/helicase